MPRPDVSQQGNGGALAAPRQPRAHRRVAPGIRQRGSAGGSRGGCEPGGEGGDGARLPIPASPSAPTRTPVATPAHRPPRPDPGRGHRTAGGGEVSLRPSSLLAAVEPPDGLTLAREAPHEAAAARRTLPGPGERGVKFRAAPVLSRRAEAKPGR